MYDAICQANGSVGTTINVFPFVVAYPERTVLPADVGAQTIVDLFKSIFLITLICQGSNVLKPFVFNGGICSYNFTNCNSIKSDFETTSSIFNKLFENSDFNASVILNWSSNNRRKILQIDSLLLTEIKC